MPGVSNFDFSVYHHIRKEIHPNARAGMTKGNPFHEDCMRVAQVIGLDFSINCDFNWRGEVIGVISGSLDVAFALSVMVCKEKLRNCRKGGHHHKVELSPH